MLKLVTALAAVVFALSLASGVAVADTNPDYTAPPPSEVVLIPPTSLDRTPSEARGLPVTGSDSKTGLYLGGGLVVAGVLTVVLASAVRQKR